MIKITNLIVEAGGVVRELPDQELKRWVTEENNDREKYKLNDDDIGGLRRYIDLRIRPGEFFMAILENDLKEACGRADHINRRKLFEYVSFLYNVAPMSCWGSKEKVKAWLEGAE